MRKKKTAEKQKSAETKELCEKHIDKKNGINRSHTYYICHTLSAEFSIFFPGKTNNPLKLFVGLWHTAHVIVSEATRTAGDKSTIPA